MSRQLLLEIKNLHTGYGNNFSLKDINLQLGSGEFLALIGPNGSGKSTLLRCMSGGLKYNRGEINLNGKPLSEYNYRQMARFLAVALQHTSRPAQMTVREYVLLGRYPWLGISGFFGARDRQYALDALKLCGMDRYALRTVESLSGGEWQRIVLARTICQIMGVSPAIIAPDEISSALDPSSAMEIFTLLASMCSKGIAICASVHDCNLAALFASHILALKNGKIQFYGEIKDVFTAQNLSGLYDMPVGIFLHPDLGLPQYYPRFGTNLHSRDIQRGLCQ